MLFFKVSASFSFVVLFFIIVFYISILFQFSLRFSLKRFPLCLFSQFLSSSLLFGYFIAILCLLVWLVPSCSLARSVSRVFPPFAVLCQFPQFPRLSPYFSSIALTGALCLPLAPTTYTKHTAPLKVTSS